MGDLGSGMIHAHLTFCVALWLKVAMKQPFFFFFTAVFLKIYFKGHLHQNHLGCLLKTQVSRGGAKMAA